MASSAVDYDAVRAGASQAGAASTGLAVPLQSCSAPRGCGRETDMRTRMSATAVVTVMAAGIVAGAAAPAVAQWRDRQPRDGICVYKDADFRGQRVCLEAGE